MSELMFRSATELAELVRSGECSAVSLVEESLRRIDELQPTINAFTHVARESALATATEIEPGDPRPFAGVPIAIKDNRAVDGMPLTMCSDLFGNFVPHHDSFLVRRIREAGFVIVGKTTLPEMGILPTTESRRFGPTRNPWALDRTPGGSSGGSAAAVAAGMVPIAHGNDGGGSIRIPASCCGLVGLKPARGRVSVGPESGQSFLVGDGVLTRTVADTAQVLDVLAGYEPGDATWAPPPPGRYGELALQAPGRLRIGLALNVPRSRRGSGAEVRAGGPRRRVRARVARPRGAGDHAPVVRSRTAARLHPRLRPARLDGHPDRGAARRPRADRGRRRAADLGAVGARPRHQHASNAELAGQARDGDAIDRLVPRALGRCPDPGAGAAAGADRRDQRDGP